MATRKAKATVSRAKKAGGAVKPKTQAAKTEITKERVVYRTPAKKGALAKFFAKKYEGTENIFNIFNKPAIIGALIAEIIGVFVLTTIFMTVGGDPLYMMFGVVGLSIVVYSLSGAHLNPLISLGAFVTRRISGIRFLFYVIAQVVGAMLAYVVLKQFLTGAPEVSAEAAAYGQQAPELLKMAELTVREGVALEWYLAGVEFLGAILFALFFARGLQYRKSVFTFAFTAGVGLFTGLLSAILVTSKYLGLAGAFVLNPAIAVALETFNAPDPTVSGTETLNTEVPVMLMIFAAAPLIGGVIGFLLNDVLAATNKSVEA